MTDKEILIKVREKVEKLKKDLPKNRGYKRNAYNHVLSIIDSMQEKPKQCMYSKDNYTEEDRKVLCEGCEEKCEFNQVKESAILQHKEETCKENGDSLTQEPVSEDLEEAADNALGNVLNTHEIVNVRSCLEMFRLGAKWQKEKEYTCYEEAFEDGAKWKVENLWKPADGDDLPEYEREVVVFTQNYPDDAGMMMVAIGHRPTPDGYDGKSLTTGEVEHYIPETYGKGGWNIPDVKFWLDVELPKEIEL